MKICFISPEVPPYLSGGAGVATLNFSKILVKHGHDVTIISRRLSDGEPFEIVDGVKIYRLRCTKVRFFRFSHVLFLIKALKLIKKEIFDADIYYGQTTLSPGLITAILHKRYNKNTIVHVRGIDFNRRFSFPIKDITQFVFKNNVILTLSKEHQEVLEKETGKKVYYLTNGVDISFDKSKEECRRQLHFSNKTYVVYVGRLDEVKGLIYAIKAVEFLKNVILHIIGEESGNNRTETEKLAKYVREHGLQNRVFFHGKQDRDKVFAYVKAADIFVHPLLIAAGMGNAVLEAMFLKTPVIGTNTGYFKEIIKNNHSGILVNKADSESLKNAILKLENKEFAKIIVENASNYIRDNHNWERMVTRLEGIVKNEFNI